MVFPNLLNEPRDENIYVDFGLFLKVEPEMGSHTLQAPENVDSLISSFSREKLAQTDSRCADSKGARNVFPLLDKLSNFTFSPGVQSNNHGTIFYAISPKFLTAVTIHLISIE